jgi:ketosteroid isomerase-like protein
MSTYFGALGAALLTGALLMTHRSADVRSQSDSTAVAAVVERYQMSLDTGDSATAVRLLAHDAVILESGDVETREEYRSHHLPADIEFARAVTSDRGPLTVVTQGDVAWSVRTSRAHGSFRGRAIDSQGAELMILSRGKEGWRIRAIHWSSHALNRSR